MIALLLSVPYSRQWNSMTKIYLPRSQRVEVIMTYLHFHMEERSAEPNYLHEQLQPEGMALTLEIMSHRPCTYKLYNNQLRVVCIRSVM